MYLHRIYFVCFVANNHTFHGVLYGFIYVYYSD